MSGAFGRFEGRVVALWLQDQGPDRNMQLVEDFAYVDPDGKRWPAPAGSVINGATIPPILWDDVGPPYVGDYRRASVVHDVACETRTEPSEAVHLMFYHAMRCDGMTAVKATLMYRAVKHFGPSWRLGVDFAVMTTAAVRGDAEASQAYMDQLRRAVAVAVEEAPSDVDIHSLDTRIDALMAAPVPAAPQQKKTKATKRKVKKAVKAAKVASKSESASKSDTRKASKSKASKTKASKTSKSKSKMSKTKPGKTKATKAAGRKS